MSTFSRQRKLRIRGFESRASNSADVRTYRNWRYITVHPFADEPELLARLCLSPADCKIADVWWHTGTDVVLLCTSADSSDSAATTVSWFGDPPYLSVRAELKTSTTTIVQLHELMDRIAECGLPKRFYNRGSKVLFKT